MQAYFPRDSHAELFLAGQTVNIHLPLTNRLNRRSVRTIIRIKNALQPNLQREVFPDD